MLAEQMPGANILLLREDGQQVMNTALSPGTPLPARRDTTSLRKLFATGQSSISDVFSGMVVHRPVIALEVPVRNADGQVIYGLTLNPAADLFAEIVRQQHLNTGSIVSILDREGTIIARTPNDARFVGKKAGSAVLSRLPMQAEGIVENASLEGIPVITAFSRVPEVGWSVVIGLPRAELVEAARRAALVTFGAGMACLALGLGLAHVMARGIIRPIASLRALSTALEQNDPDVAAATGLAETDEVAQTMIAALHQRLTAEVARHIAEDEREQAASLLRTVIETAPSLIYAKDLSGRVIMANGMFLNALGKTRAEVIGRTDLEFRNDPARAEAVMAVNRRVLATGQPEVSEELFGDKDNYPRVWLSIKAPLQNTNQEVIGLVGVAVEITERKRVEDRLRLMVDELNHRVKNTLATVQSVAMHTLRGIDQVVRHTLEARLGALAAAHDVLTREQWEGANLEDVVAGALTPYGGKQDSRFEVSGPPLRLQPRVAVALSMGLHELATNALKYGALSVGSGRVNISWTVEKGPPSRLYMIWSERSGPAVTPPTQRGFGTRLIERSLAQDLGGTAQIMFMTKGVTCIIDAPLVEIVAPAEVLVFRRAGIS